MDIPGLKFLLSNVDSFLHLSASSNVSSDLARIYYKNAEEMLNLLTPFLDGIIIDSESGSKEELNKAIEELAQYVNELKELFESWEALSSKLYYVLNIEPLIAKIQSYCVDIFCLLKTSGEHQSDELSLASLESCLQKVKKMGCEQKSSEIEGLLREQKNGAEYSSDILVKIAENLGLRSNQEILIEVVALDKLKENAEQAEKTADIEFIDQLISIVTHLQEHLILIVQSQTTSPIPIPIDYCCPLSLELMTDPVILESGQTYERVFIKKWIDLGLIVCPKTRQSLSHTNLIPNYTVKALIASWCELNNVKIPDPMKSISLNQSLLVSKSDSSAPTDSHAFTNVITNQSLSPVPVRSTENLESSGQIQREGPSPMHPRSASEGSLSGVVIDHNGLDDTFSSNGFDDTFSSNGLDDAVSELSILPAIKGSSDAVDGGQSSQNHAGSAYTNKNFARGKHPDTTENSDVSTNVTAYNNGDSAEIKMEGQATASSSTPQRESSAFLMGTRSRSTWRGPSERLIPRIVSPLTVEPRADISGIEAQLQKLIENLRSPLIDAQREAAYDIRQLAKLNTDNRIVIANSGALMLLIELLHSSDTMIQENAVTALMNLSINDNNKSAIADAGAIEPLIHVLKTGSPESKENSAATLFSLSVIGDNKIKIGRAGAVEPLVDLLRNGNPRGKKDASSALFNLSLNNENKIRIVEAGAIRYLVELLDPAAGMVDKAVAVLANLSSVKEGRIGIGQENGIPVLVEVVELGSARAKENAAATLYQLCANSSKFCNMVLQEGAVPPLVALSQSGTARGKEKAQTLLKYFQSQRNINSTRG